MLHWRKGSYDDWNTDSVVRARENKTGTAMENANSTGLGKYFESIDRDEIMTTDNV